MTVIDRLYALPLATFTKERTRLSTEAKSKSERAEIRAIPKPSPAAWMIDAIAREASDLVEALFTAGAALSHAQSKGERAAIQEATRALRTRLSSVTKEARSRGASATTLHRIQSTLQAALVDEGVRALVLASRLAHDVELEGFGALAGADTSVGTAKDHAAEKPADANAKRKAREAQEARVAKAEKARLAREARAAAAKERMLAKRAHAREIAEARALVADAEKQLKEARKKLRAVVAARPKS